jgi:5-(carboxyamino)imidazole ribonucleotide mutase
MKNEKPHVGIIMGSDSDLETMAKAAKQLEEFGISYEITVLSAHRTPKKAFEYARTARARGLKVVIAGAGMAAALPGVIAAETTLPVIGVPIKGSAFEGLDALLSMVQMPPGIPVATVAVNGAKNAAVLAASIIGVADKSVQKKLGNYKKTMAAEVLKKNQKLQKIGYKKYLEG